MTNQGIISRVSLPYAEALLEFAQENDCIDKTNQDLSLISKLLTNSLELRKFLDNPLITSTVKKKVLNSLLLDQVNSFVLKFLLVLVDRRRITILGSIIQKYLELSYKLDSITIAEIRTAIAFTELQQFNIIEKLKQITHSKEVKLVVKIDPSLIGGFVVQIGSKVIDTSLQGKLKQMSVYLNGTIA